MNKEPRTPLIHRIELWDNTFDQVKAGQARVIFADAGIDFRSGDYAELVRMIPAFKTTDRSAGIPRIADRSATPINCMIRDAIDTRDGYQILELGPNPPPKLVRGINLAAWALAALFIGLIAGGFIREAQDAQRAEQCSLYGRYCPSSAVIAAIRDQGVVVRYDRKHGTATVRAESEIEWSKEK